MSIDDRTKGYGTIWTDWTIGELIGHGSGGKTAVYNLTRENPGFVEEDVLKIVNLIEENIPIDEMSKEFREDYEEKKQDAIDKATEEVKLMHRLRNSRNIVSYQDFKVHTTNGSNSTHTDLLIRMHKYSELGTILKKKTLSEEEVVNVGIDICCALEECQKQGIIHRDIKPGNIFYDGNNYLLGDFGISKILENGDIAQTYKGTPQYAAPEQFGMFMSKNGYDHRVDIYSLGLTLYYIANHGKLPFVESGRNISAANQIRLEGTAIPPISGISRELNEIILKACSFAPENRYSSAREMKKELLGIVTEELQMEDVLEFEKTETMETEVALGYEKTETMETEAALGYENSEIVETEAALGYEKTEIMDNKAVEMKKVAVTEKNVAEESREKSVEVVCESDEELIRMLSECVQTGDINRGNEIASKLAQYTDLKFLYYEVNNKYNNDISIKQDVTKAIFWYEKCIELCKDSWTVSLAEYQLANIYLQGTGIKKNIKRAEELFSSSAAKGNPYAMKKFVAGRFVKK